MAKTTYSYPDLPEGFSLELDCSAEWPVEIQDGSELAVYMHIYYGKLTFSGDRKRVSFMRSYPRWMSFVVDAEGLKLTADSMARALHQRFIAQWVKNPRRVMRRARKLWRCDGHWG